MKVTKLKRRCEMCKVPSTKPGADVRVRPDLGNQVLCAECHDMHDGLKGGAR